MTEHALIGFNGTDQPSASIYDTCIRCGLCLPSCPTYLETMTETSGPRGRISLIKAVGESRLDLLSAGFVEQMWECLDCRACEAVCPSGRPLRPTRRDGAHANSARAGTHRAGARAYAAPVSVAHALRSPRSHAPRRNPAALRATNASDLTGRTRWPRDCREAGAKGVEYVLRRAGSALRSGRSSRGRISSRGLHHAGRLRGGAPRNGSHVAPGRIIRSRSERARMLRSDCGPCGRHGFCARTRQTQHRRVRAQRADVYVVNAAGCGSALKEYAELFAGDPAWVQRAAAFSHRVRDVTEVLDALDLGQATRPLDATVTYQEPCHLVHAQRVAGAPRRLLARIPRLRLVEMEESAVCCGSAGIYNLTQPEMASRLQRRKIEAIRRTGATIVATANPGCAISVAAGLRDAGCRVTVKHIVELLDEAYEKL